MSKLSQPQKVYTFLKQHSGQRFNAREIALAITSQYPEDYLEKRNNPRFNDDREFISQIVAEIGSQKSSIQNSSPNIHWQDKPRPRVYWYNSDSHQQPEIPETDDDLNDQSVSEQHHLTEHDLYPILINYLKSEHHLYCLRIDEKTSKIIEEMVAINGCILTL